jgi:ABC-type transporter Mla MlaB component
MRDETLTIATEQHGSAATIYVAGEMSIASVIRLVRVCDGLPPPIRFARIDLRAVHTADAAALTLLRTSLRHWRRPRGRIHLGEPGARAEPLAPFRASTR